MGCCHSNDLGRVAGYTSRLREPRVSAIVVQGKDYGILIHEIYLFRFFGLGNCLCFCHDFCYKIKLSFANCASLIAARPKMYYWYFCLIKSTLLKV